MIELHKSRDNMKETNHRYDSDDGRMAYNINSLMRLTTVSTVEYDTLNVTSQRVLC